MHRIKNSKSRSTGYNACNFNVKWGYLFVLQFFEIFFSKQSIRQLNNTFNVPPTIFLKLLKTCDLLFPNTQKSTSVLLKEVKDSLASSTHRTTDIFPRVTTLPRFHPPRGCKYVSFFHRGKERGVPEEIDAPSFPTFRPLRKARPSLEVETNFREFSTPSRR